ncbi:MAG: DNA repair protein RecO [Planctomycetota bacterium]|jgi:DNA repair protein RecO (recombination protein O)
MAVLRAIVWKRIDYRESSRLVTLLTRERGKLSVLAKGAHRPKSPHIGCLDFLNLLEVRLAGKGLPILGRTRLIHEARGLREPRRFLACNYLAEIFDRAWVDGRQDMELFDLVEGSLLLIAGCPEASLPQVLAGIELRFLAILGQGCELENCSICGQVMGEPGLFLSKEMGGLYCDAHRPRVALRAPREALLRLMEINSAPGRAWPSLPTSTQDRRALDILGIWIASAVEYLPRSRQRLLRQLR